MKETLGLVAHLLDGGGTPKGSKSGVLVHYLADEHWSGSVTETSLPDFPFFNPVSGWPEGISGRPRPNVERSMLGAGEEASHANDAGFGVGRSGAVGDSG